ncbi:amidohydrolase family protein [Purpureocillium lavendulum]|uniref:Amidohydrolase family protein n=1 Tax=Purpureocillium lavendulum TaxID=1247861 RepID=A0AB34G112_9HYPO|nr:amidohydrolase family protein [Purpureocillium lavendulum]
MATLTVFIRARFLDPTGSVGPGLINEQLDCMVVSGSKISYLGKETDDAVQLARRAGANIIDLQSSVVAPGFIDSHVHLLMFGASSQKLDLSGCKSLSDIRETISQYCARNKNLPQILCKGWLQSMTDGLALASMLDGLDARPIFIDSMDLHSVWCNKAALDLLPLGKMQDACGEFVTTDANGTPTGLMAEMAVTAFVWPLLASLSTMEENHASLDNAIEQYVAAGYTGVIDMAMDSNTWTALETYRDAKGIPLHVAAHWYIPYEEDRKTLLDHVEEAVEMHRRWHPSKFPGFCIIGVKLMCDGTVDGCTAALSYPYGSNPDFVKPIWPAEAMELVVKRAADAGLQIAIHAIGDAAVTQAINSIAKAASPSGRHRIEHLELASAEDAKRLGQLGITASIQPVHSDPAILKGYSGLIETSTFDTAFPKTFAFSEFVQRHHKELLLINPWNTNPALNTVNMAKYYLALEVAECLHNHRDRKVVEDKLQDLFWHDHRHMRGIEKQEGRVWWVDYNDIEDARKAFDMAKYREGRWDASFDNADIVDESGKVVEHLWPKKYD